MDLYAPATWTVPKVLQTRSLVAELHFRLLRPSPFHQGVVLVLPPPGVVSAYEQEFGGVLPS